MKKHLMIYSCLALAMALFIGNPSQASAAESTDGKPMMDSKMMEQCQTMKEKKEKMSSDIKAQDADLTEQLAKMNSAQADKKVDLMASIVTQMIEQRSVMNTRKAAMEAEMMQHMMQHMQMGKESMSQCPMMKGMKGMKGMDDKSEDTHKEHH